MSTEAYQKVGRGGAGNFYSKQDLESLAGKPASLQEDIGSQHPSSSTTTSPPLAPSEYQHTGRGGAGNWIAPSELSTSGLTQTSSLPTKQTLGNGIRKTYKAGRGGVGNYIDAGNAVAGGEEQRKREEEEDRMKKEVKRRVEEDIERGLRRPERVFMGAGEGRERERERGKDGVSVGIS